MKATRVVQVHRSALKDAKPCTIYNTNQCKIARSRWNSDSTINNKKNKRTTYCAVELWMLSKTGGCKSKVVPVSISLFHNVIGVILKSFCRWCPFLTMSLLALRFDKKRSVVRNIFVVWSCLTIYTYAVQQLIKILLDCSSSLFQRKNLPLQKMTFFVEKCCKSIYQFFAFMCRN